MKYLALAIIFGVYASTILVARVSSSGSLSLAEVVLLTIMYVFAVFSIMSDITDRSKKP